MSQSITLQTAPVFSWVLTIENTAFRKLGNLRISHSVSGYGTYGVVTSTMTAKTYDGDIFAEDIAINAEAVLQGFGITSPKYYVTGRKIDGRITDWTLCDAMSKSEQVVDFTDGDFTDDKISYYAVLEKVRQMCGLTDIEGNFPDMSSFKLERNQVEGASGHSLLNTISAALFGYFFAYGTVLKFVNFGSSAHTSVALHHSKIIFGSTKNFSRIIMTDEKNTYTAGDGSLRNTLTVDTDHASEELARAALENMLWQGGNEFRYKAWCCEKGITTSWMYLGSIIFEEGILYANNITMFPSAGGMFFSASCNAVTEDEATYLSETERQLRARIALGHVNGNTAIDRSGLYFFENDYKKKQKDDTEKTVKYGFDVTDSGVAVYDSAIVSSQTFESAKKVGSNQLQVNYPNAKFLITVNKTGDTIRMIKERIRENTGGGTQNG